MHVLHDEDNYYHPLPKVTPPQPPHHKRRLNYDNDDEEYVPGPNKSKADDTHHQIEGGFQLHFPMQQRITKTLVTKDML